MPFKKHTSSKELAAMTFGRRFWRVDMPLKLMILPSSPIIGKDIYVTGADYFPEQIKSQIKSGPFDARSYLNQISKHQHLMTSIFNEFFQATKFFEESLIKINKGLNPALEQHYQNNYAEYSRGIGGLANIENRASYTFYVLSSFQQKLIAYIKNLHQTLRSSNPSYFVSPKLQTEWSMDSELRKLVKKESVATVKDENIPFIKALIALGNHIKLVLGVYDRIYLDCNYRNKPDFWPKHQVNISECGLSTQIEKEFGIKTKVDVGIKFDNHNAVFFKGAVVRDFAVDFEFAHGHDQSVIAAAMQEYELNRALRCYEKIK